MISGSKLGIKSADELNNEESNKSYLREMYNKYDKQRKGHIFSQNVDADDNGGVEVKAVIEGLLISKFIPPKIKKPTGVNDVKFTPQLSEVRKKEESDKYRLPTFLF